MWRDSNSVTTEQLRQSGASEQHNTSTIRSDNAAPLAADIWPDCTDPPKRLINWILPSDCDNATGLPSVHCYLNAEPHLTLDCSELGSCSLTADLCHCCHLSCLLCQTLVLRIKFQRDFYRGFFVLDRDQIGFRT